LPDTVSPPSASRNPPGGAAARLLRFDRLEWAGAFGDLGTLVPFLVAYIEVGHVPPTGALCAFGLALVAAGLVYRTPMPVQPMKTAGAVVATQAAALALAPQAVFAATLVTGLIWLVLGVSGVAQRIASLLGRPVIAGVVVGLGLALMWHGVRMMTEGWIVGAVTLAGTLALLTQRKIPAMFVVILFGALVALLRRPELIGEMRGLATTLQWHLPGMVAGEITTRDLLLGTLFVALPQVPLTLGNAIVAVTAENNRMFPDCPTSERKVSITTGVMNTLGGLIGGVPMCHGVGGLAAQARFGARTGGAPIIFGAVLLVLAFGIGDSLPIVLQLFPASVLGAVLFLAGAQLAGGQREWGRNRAERFVMFGTAAVTIWNAGAACVFGAVAMFVVGRLSAGRAG
jgi:MFS superfamily sulfate permease-like transporter